MRFGVKAARDIDKVSSKIFQFNFASLPFITTDKLFCTRNLFVRQLVLQLGYRRYYCLGDIMYFTYSFTSFLRRKEGILTQKVLLCERFDNFAPKCTFLASNIEAILTDWHLKNTFFTFLCDSGISKLLNCLDQINIW